MTRINVGVDPKELPDKLLLAEHREITRIPNAIKNNRFSMEGCPREFTLGKGHVKFFYNKLGYLHDRYVSLYKECVNREFNVTAKHESFRELPAKFLGNYVETDRDRAIILERIHSKGFSLLEIES